LNHKDNIISKRGRSGRKSYKKGLSLSFSKIKTDGTFIKFRLDCKKIGPRVG
jgi:hypothetical protein